MARVAPENGHRLNFSWRVMCSRVRFDLIENDSKDKWRPDIFHVRAGYGIFRVCIENVQFLIISVGSLNAFVVDFFDYFFRFYIGNCV